MRGTNLTNVSGVVPWFSWSTIKTYEFFHLLLRIYPVLDHFLLLWLPPIYEIFISHSYYFQYNQDTQRLHTIQVVLHSLQNSCYIRSMHFFSKSAIYSFAWSTTWLSCILFLKHIWLWIVMSNTDRLLNPQNQIYAILNQINYIIFLKSSPLLKIMLSALRYLPDNCNWSTFLFSKSFTSFFHELAIQFIAIPTHYNAIPHL